MLDLFNPAYGRADDILSQGQGDARITGLTNQGGWDALLGQLRSQAFGTGPSMAAQRYRQMNQDALANQLAMARGMGTPGAGFGAQRQMGALNQGLAQGMGQAQTQEQLGAQGLYGQTLGQYGNMDLQRQLANQRMYGQALGMQAGMPSPWAQGMGFVGNLAQGAAMMG